MTHDPSLSDPLLVDSGEAISIVYAEDDAKLARLTATYLESFGIRVVVEPDGRATIATVLRERPDVILLDITLAGANGLDLCRQLRARVATPIIMVTARGEEVDRILGLEGGADDYIAKPFSPRELLARVRAQARRARGAVGPRNEIRVGPLAIDRGKRHVMLDERELDLTTYEFDLLLAFAERPGHVFSREQLIEIVRGSADEAFDRSIDVRISRLRQKLGDDPRHSRLLKTVRGVGYVLVPGRS